jgi:MFS superfamily sulfate permease-like transporter
MTLSNYLKDASTYNTHAFRSSPLSEISGSLGDLGTLLPLFIALSTTHSIAPASTLVFSGLANIATGLLFGLPIPVQPMKAIAAAAIDGRFDVQRTVAAGVLVSGAVFVLAVSGTLKWLGSVVPTPIVRGIQVGAGLQLVVSVGQKMVAGMGWVRPRWSDNYLWMMAAFGFLVVCAALERRRTVVPFALVVTVVGVVLAVLPAHRHDHDEGLHMPLLWHPRIYSFTWRDFRDAIPTAVGQLPLTTLNSILATSHLAALLLPSRPTPSLGHIGISLAITNFISAPFGAMPICHGSGGLAGQYRFGARSGASVMFLGTIKLLLGLFAAGPVIWVIRRFPSSILGIMVLAAGIELAKVAESVNSTAMDLREGEDHYRSLNEDERNRRFSVMLVTVAGILAFRNDAVGFLAGLVWHIGVHADNYWKNKRRWTFSWGRRGQAESEPLIH